MTQRVWPFGFGDAAVPPEPAVALLGGKGAGLAAMSRLGLPVPPGFTIATTVCDEYFAHNRTLPDGLDDEVADALLDLARATNKSFVYAGAPLLVSVRSGAPVSMPGMTDTILGVGLNAETLPALERRIGPAAHDVYGRLTDSFAEHDGLPQDVQSQLWLAIRAVLDSWQSRRAVSYRQMHGLTDSPGTAVTIQAMVFGNAGAGSATGVAFTRDPATGAPEPFGEYLPNAQGEAVVGGIATPRPLAELRAEMPAAHAELLQHFRTLERHFAAMQDVEFTIERGTLWLLQTRTGLIGVEAGARIAVDMVEEGLLDRRAALARVDLAALRRAPVHTVQAGAGTVVLAKGLPASLGAASGAVVFSTEEAQAAAARGAAVILVLPETRPRDVPGIHAAAGVVTSRGGATSHAAVVARGMGRPCVVGAADIVVGDRRFTARGRTVAGGDVITLDGATGEVFLGALPLVGTPPTPAVRTLLRWAAELGIA
jgi:pyruvate,orthophosphate dikinase